MLCRSRPCPPSYFVPFPLLVLLSCSFYLFLLGFVPTAPCASCARSGHHLCLFGHLGSSPCIPGQLPFWIASGLFLFLPIDFLWRPVARPPIWQWWPLPALPRSLGGVPASMAFLALYRNLTSPCPSSPALGYCPHPYPPAARNFLAFAHTSRRFLAFAHTLSVHAHILSMPFSSALPLHPKKGKKKKCLTKVRHFIFFV